MKYLRFLWLLIFPIIAWAAVSYPYFAPGGALSCTGSCTQQTVNLAAGSSFITGTLPQSNILTCAANQIVFDNASGTLACSANLTWTDSTRVLVLGNTSPAVVQFPATHISTRAQFEASAFTATNGISFGTGAINDGSASGVSQCQADSSTRFYETTFFLNGQGDFTLCSGFTLPQFIMNMLDDTANNVGIFGVQNANGSGPSVGVNTTTTTNCIDNNGSTVLPTSPGPCSFISSTNPEAGGDNVPIAIIQEEFPAGKHFVLYNTSNSLFMAIGDTAPVKFLTATSTGSNQATVVLGDTNSSSVTTIQSGGAINLSGTAVLSGSTVAGLPTCNAGLKGGMRYVTDATAPLYNAALTGGGAVVVPVFCNGTAWTSH
jgi:hypothetical protein